jgi:hypothetical protein
MDIDEVEESSHDGSRYVIVRQGNKKRKYQIRKFILKEIMRISSSQNATN